jgi:hypothetical protein
MKYALLTLAAMLIAAPASAGVTPAYVTCDFMREGQLTTDTLGMWHEDQAVLTVMGFDQEAMTRRTGGTIHVFSKEEWPHRWLWAINMQERTAISFSEGYPITSSECRGGAE